MNSHGREKRAPTNQPDQEKSVDWPAVIQLAETRGVLLSGKGYVCRVSPLASDCLPRLLKFPAKL
jgi:hypothetical protein